MQPISEKSLSALVLQGIHGQLLGRLTDRGSLAPRRPEIAQVPRHCFLGLCSYGLDFAQLPGPVPAWDCSGPTLQDPGSGRAGVKARGPCGLLEPEIVTAQQAAHKLARKCFELEDVMSPQASVI